MSEKPVKSISVRANAELHKDLRVYAAEHDTSIDKVCLMAIESWWSQQPEKALYAKRRETESKQVATPVSTPKEPKAEVKSSKGSKAKKA